MSEDAEVLKIFVSTGESCVPRICLKAVKKRNSHDPVSAADFVTLTILAFTNTNAHLSVCIYTKDNHLGFSEKDPVRGNDSFAAFEEVLFLAKSQRCDMVVLSGDMFHDNKPSRATILKTIKILRKYCLGPNPVKFEIVSDQSNFVQVSGGGCGGGVERKESQKRSELCVANFLRFLSSPTSLPLPPSLLP